MVHELSVRDARRIAVRAQLLAAPRPTDVLDVVRHLSVLQADPTAAVAPSAELVLWSRLGGAYRYGDLDRLLGDGSLVEFRGLVRPAEDMALFRAEMELWHQPDVLTGWRRSQANWVEANDGARRDILEKLYDEGPLVSRALPDTTEVPWQSSGWNNDRNVRMLLELMERRGEVASPGRDGRDRLWDLAERVFPDDAAVPYDDAIRTRDERRLHSLGIARPKGPECPVEPNDVGLAGEPAVIEGVRGQWRVDPAYLDGDFEGRVAILSPLDRLVYDRKRMVDLFAFDYQLEMYKPAAQRRWGYWALPVLSGENLVGKVDATADDKAGLLYVDAVHEDVAWSKQLKAAVDEEIESLALWLGLSVSGR
ncbi:MAG TPA: crosslink repair DNA glycosylase YcaQ family protein [Nocardioidaceae bacterium]|nr:crosslink repair DNA glycosylase YcaQ family protein [Nocardioidaceae bacterium]